MRVRLIHWKEAEAGECVERLGAAGYVVEYDPPDAKSTPVGTWGKDPPSAFVIDLSRLPSHGRAVASVVRQSKALRHVPIVFVGGEPEKVERARALLPDATFTSWTRIRSALKGAIAKPPAKPVVPKDLVHSDTALVKKLGVKPRSTLLLIEAPGGFVDLLDELPEGATLRDRGRGDLVIWFVRAAEDLERDIERVVKTAGLSPLWIARPKQSSGVATDVTEALVRSVGLAMGMVDYKICSIDATWSGILFRTPRDPAPGS